jgi:Na+/H+-dicarboxylate symporter
MSNLIEYTIAYSKLARLGGKVGLASAMPSLAGGAIGATVGNFMVPSTKKLKKRHPDWSDEKIKYERMRLKRKRALIGGAIGTVIPNTAIGGISGHLVHKAIKKYTPNEFSKLVNDSVAKAG